MLVGWLKVTIDVGASLSNAISIEDMKVVALRQGANCEGTTFTAQASYDGGTTFDDLQTDSAEWSVTKSATLAQLIVLPDARRICGPTHLKLRTGTSSTPTAQSGAAADIWVAVVPCWASI